MADFAAVIRRAVDGLSDNTPEMRVKVYEKARGAVQRQLESMKPRPPEEMLRRQLDKLETAIIEVENEHAEALPALDGDDTEDAAYDTAEAWEAQADQPEEGAAETVDEPPAEPAYADVAVADAPSPVMAETTAAEFDDGVHPSPEPAPAEEPAGWQAEETTDAAEDVAAAPIVELVLGPDIIQHAIDALPEKTPEMRARIYNDARNAVQRHLGGITPPPAADILQRQYDKLEAAIAEVESRYAPRAETLPAATIPAAVAAGDPVAAANDAAGDPEPVREREPWDPPEEEQAPVAAAEQSSQGLVPDERQIGLWQQPLPEVEQPPVAVETVDMSVHDTGTGWDDTDTPQAPVLDEQATPVVSAGSTELLDAADRDDPHYINSAPAAYGWDAAPAESRDERAPAIAADDDWLRTAEPVAVSPADFDDVADRRDGEENVVAAPVQADDVSPPPERHGLNVEPEWVREHRDDPEPVAADPWQQPEQPCDGSQDFGDFLGSVPAVNGDAVVEPKMPAALDLLAWDDTAPAGGDKAETKPAVAPADPFDADDNFFKDEPVAAGAAAARPQESWSDLDELIGGSGRAGTKAKDERDLTPPDLATVVAQRQTKSFRAEPKRRVNYAAIFLGVFGLALVGGGGYAAWMYRDTVAEVVNDLIASGPQVPGTDTKPADTAADTPTANATRGTTELTTNGAAATDTQVPAAGQNAETPTDVASLDAAPAINKFTQRLNTDGSEVDEGPAVPAGEAQPVEGKSVAEQNVASSQTTAGATPTTEQTPATGDTAATPGATPGATTTDAATPTTPTAEQPVTTPVGTGQKMFLYEERLGQSVPTAIEGTVAWSLQQETGENGKSEPVVQGQINVPDRGLSALITFKRNSDPSLPASHLVEIVFSLPAGFEGGSIDSVQRIAMKQTEQDRGNALIAVPAKITDDFHMIALNDFPDARKTNLELLRTRNWIDMPITYRNGRRALLTMDKGTSGVDAFNTAIREWLALGDAPTGQ